MATWNIEIAGAFPRTTWEAPVTNYMAPFGEITDSITAENTVEVRARVAFTLDNLYIKISANSQGSASTLRSRRNGANGNLSVTIPASTTGVIEDTVNSDSIVSGDLFNTQIVTGGMMGDTVQINVVSYVLENVLGLETIIASTDIRVQGENTTEYQPIAGSAAAIATVPTDIDYLLRVASVFANFRIFVNQNGINVASTATLHIDAANGNSTVSIPASTTGDVEDTVNSDSVSSGSRVAYEIAIPVSMMTTDNLGFTVLQIEQTAGGSRTMGVASANPENINFGATRFLGMEGSPGQDGPTESVVQTVARGTVSVENYFVRIFANTLNAATTIALRELGITSALSVSVPASTSGDFEDTVDQVAIFNGNTFNHTWDASASSSGLAEVNTIGLEETNVVLDDMSWYPSDPQGIQRDVEVLAY